MAQRKSRERNKETEEIRKSLESQGVDVEAASKERIAMKERIKKLGRRLEAAESQATFVGSFEAKEKGGKL